MDRKHNQISVRVPAELHEQLLRLATRNERTLAQEARRAISLHVEAEAKAAA